MQATTRPHEFATSLPRHQPPTEQAPIPSLLTKALIRKHFVPIADRTLARWVSSGVFPRPDIAIGGKVRYWKRDTVEAWIDAHSERAGA